VLRESTSCSHVDTGNFPDKARIFAKYALGADTSNIDAMFRYLRRTSCANLIQNIHMPEPSNPLPFRVAEALNRGNLIEAIKLLRDARGTLLGGAKSAIEEYVRGVSANSYPATRPAGGLVQKMHPGNKGEGMESQRDQAGNPSRKEAGDPGYGRQVNAPTWEGGSPGEMPKSAGAIWWVVAAAAVAAWYYFRPGGVWV
jgi:hypothetical protein